MPNRWDEEFTKEVRRASDPSPFKPAWEAMEATYPRPQRVRMLRYWDWGEFKRDIETASRDFIWTTVTQLYAGDVFIILKAFDPDWMREIKRRAFEYGQQSPSSFHKMLEGTPDFHRIIDLETGKKYSFNVCKHSCFFYPWNNDPLGVFPEVYTRWAVVKTLMGLSANEFVANTPKSGVVDRIQIAQYPSKIGFLEPHSDPYLHQRLFFSGYMTKRGVDYEGGGFYLVGKNDEVIEAENDINVGDIGIGYATIYHGVAPCNRGQDPDWKSIDGRWFLSMYSNASDEYPDRHTGHPLKLNLPGVLP